MPRPEGLPKTGGRKKGTPNKKSELLPDLLANLKFDPLHRLNELMPQLDFALQAKICLDLLGYIHPQKKSY
jgi:hypothetical protein